MKKKVLFILFIVPGIFLLVNTNCKKSSEIEPPPDNGNIDPMERLKTLTVTSTAFAYGEKIPQGYTCDGENISPPLHWENVPAGTQSFAVVMYDDNAGFVHMVLFNLQPDITGLPEDIRNHLPAGAQFGQNNNRVNGYFGPCPRPGDSNMYYFYVYALDTLLNLNSDTDMLRLMNAMNGHIMAWGELLGIYR
jgi:Raf kinase inhibitor-like YbhB/YbcL family protein